MCSLLITDVNFMPSTFVNNKIFTFVAKDHSRKLSLMKDRLAQFLHLEQLSPARFADILGVQRSGISHILSGRNKPGFDLIEKMLTKFSDINAEWLITGKGKMYKEKAAPPTLFDTQIDSPSEVIPEKVTKPFEQTSHEERSISKIVIFYSDKSFSDFHPE